MRMLQTYGSPTVCLSRTTSGRGQTPTPLPGFIGVLIWMPLQTSVSVERHFSRIFPAHPRSLASVLIPRPATLAVLLRSPRRTPFGSGFPNKNLPRYKRAAAAQNAGEIFLRSLHRNHAFGLGSGAHSHPTTHRTCVEDPGISRRFAQECPEGNPGKFNQEKLTWHFTKIA